ncbi:hypothetical protein [Candidatus Binatus sp.]|uniref:hypothetical protein n=1 Tax=Candidatus Binatus sp. TaxID=2811406 RepID=UPI003C765E74
MSIERCYLAGLAAPEIETWPPLILWIPGPRRDSVEGSNGVFAQIASLISAMIKPSSMA